MCNFMGFLVKPVPRLLAPRCVLERKGSQIMGDAAKERQFSPKMQNQFYFSTCRIVNAIHIAV